MSDYELSRLRQRIMIIFNNIIPQLSTIKMTSQTPPSSTPSSPSQQPQNTLSSKWASFTQQFSFQNIKKYGPTGVATYCAVSWPILALIFTGVKSSGKALQIAQFFKLKKLMAFGGQNIIVTLGLYKITLPFRILLTLAVLPKVIDKLHPDGFTFKEDDQQKGKQEKKSDILSEAGLTNSNGEQKKVFVHQNK